MLSCLYTEVYAAREKNGIYIPRDRYLQEEEEKKVRHEVQKDNFLIELNNNKLNLV